MRRKACFNWNRTDPIAKALKNETMTGPAADPAQFPQGPNADFTLAKMVEQSIADDCVKLPVGITRVHHIANDEFRIGYVVFPASADRFPPLTSHAKHVFRTVGTRYTEPRASENIEEPPRAARQIQNMRTGWNSQQGAADAPYLAPIAPSVAELRGIFFSDLFLVETADRGLVAREDGGLIAIRHGLGGNQPSTHTFRFRSIVGRRRAQNKTPATQKDQDPDRLRGTLRERRILEISVSCLQTVFQECGIAGGGQIGPQKPAAARCA